MAQAFDIRAFRRLLPDIARLLSGARDHEQRLAAVADLLGSTGVEVHAPTMEIAAGTSPVGVAADYPAGVAGQIRELSQSAGEQRRSAERILTDLGASTDASAASRILIVDDSADNREMTAATLEAAGFEVLTARDGLEGLLAAHCAQPAVVLMDVTMPVLDGVQAARLIRLSAATAHLRVIAHTARPEYCDGSIRAPFVEVLRKPAHPDVLVATVRRFATASRTSK